MYWNAGSRREVRFRRFSWLAIMVSVVLRIWPRFLSWAWVLGLLTLASMRLRSAASEFQSTSTFWAACSCFSSAWGSYFCVAYSLRSFCPEHRAPIKFIIICCQLYYYGIFEASSRGGRERNWLTSSKYLLKRENRTEQMIQLQQLNERAQLLQHIQKLVLDLLVRLTEKHMVSVFRRSI